jgi:hypothetical protein
MKASASITRSLKCGELLAGLLRLRCAVHRLT